ncbi:MAG TPA: hypothetical protein VD930_03755 [Gemmatimonadales bacterium]|nr:hypothetical protein [Gemmatimonadales bacterium]
MLRIPAGALHKTTLIRMEAPSDTLNYVVLSPEGLQFDTRYPPTLSLSYRNCPDVTRPLLDVVYVDDAMTTVLETIEPVATDTLDRAVHARLRHFSKYVLKSRYAVAY